MRSVIRMTCLLAATVAAGGAHAQGGPFRVDDTGITDPGGFKLEGWSAFSTQRSRERSVVLGAGTTLTALPFIEFTLAMARDGEARNDEDSENRRLWSTAVLPSLKAEILPLDTHGIGLALSAGFSYRTAFHRPTPDPDAPARLRRLDAPFATAIVSVAPIESVTLNLNLGVEHDRMETRTAPTWGVGAAWQASERIALVGETFGSDRGRTGLQGGLRYSALEGRLDLDLVLGRNLTDERATWLTLGFATRW
jgi:hypothetical protein